MEVAKFNPRLMTGRFLQKWSAVSGLVQDQKRRLFTRIDITSTFPEGISSFPSKITSKSTSKRTIENVANVAKPLVRAKTRPKTQLGEKPLYSIRQTKTLKSISQRSTSASVSKTDSRPASRMAPHGLPLLSSKSWVGYL